METVVFQLSYVFTRTEFFVLLNRVAGISQMNIVMLFALCFMQIKCVNFVTSMISPPGISDHVILPITDVIL